MSKLDTTVALPLHQSAVKWTLQGYCVEKENVAQTTTQTVCRLEYTEVTWTDDLSFQKTSSSALIVSSTIYIFTHFSCKLHASTLTRTKDRTINYRQIQVR